MDVLFFRVPPRPSSLARIVPSLSPAPKGYDLSVQVSNHRKCNIVGRCHIRPLPGCLSNHHSNNIHRKAILYGKSHKQHHVNATPEPSFGSEPEAYRSKSVWEALKASSNVFYRFTRPHTIIGTAMSIISVSLLAAESISDISALFLTGLVEAVGAALCMNIYIVGLNQLFDIDIDKVNKPNLPLASGEYSVRTGIAIVSAFAFLSFLVAGVVRSWPLFWALFVSFILGTAYSTNLPLLRWKRFALVAAMCIITVRAVVVQLCFFLHMQNYVLQRPAVFSRPLIFATAFMSFFSIVIALFKDIPDIDGDRIFGIRSFTVRLGQERVFWTCVYLLEMAYTVAMMIGTTSSSIWSKFLTVLGHGILALVLWICAKSVDLSSKAAITSFYMFIWKLFYAEYLLIPLVR